ncbi:MAG TPA: MFS transporter [Ktedonobacterales bacterium]|nr:MFS transporter [Ktedonobacterales bacterium]
MHATGDTQPTLNAAGRSPAARLWRNRDFNILWAGQTFSSLGDSFALVALPLLVLQATGSVAQMGLVTGVTGVGQIIAGIFAGVIVDRVDRRRLMITCDAARFGLYALIPLWWALRGPAFWLIYGVVLLASLLSMGFQVAYMTAVANLVDRDQITDANGRLQATFAVAYVVGPMLAGLVSARTGPVTAIGVDALSFVISAGSLLLIRLRVSALQKPPIARAAERRLGELIVGARYLWEQPSLRAITWLTALEGLLVGGGIDLFIFHLKHDLSQGDSAVGLTLGLASIGAALGSLLAPWLRRRLGFGATWIGGFAFSALALALIGPAPSVTLVATFASCFTLGDTIRAILQMSLRQELTPDHLLGRVTSAFWTIGAVPMSLGAALGAALAQHVGAPAVLFGMGIGAFLLALIGAATPARIAKPEQHTEQRSA